MVCGGLATWALHLHNTKEVEPASPSTEGTQLTYAAIKRKVKKQDTGGKTDRTGDSCTKLRFRKTNCLMSSLKCGPYLQSERKTRHIHHSILEKESETSGEINPVSRQQGVSAGPLMAGEAAVSMCSLI